MDLSIVIVSFNTKQLLDDCLSSVYRSLRKPELKYEIIVVDNVSTDGTQQILRQKYPDVQTVLNQENVGFGRANNQGIRLARGEFILLLNSDTVILNDAITKLWKFGRQHPKSFLGPKLLNSDRTSQTSCGPFFTLPVVFGSLFLKGDKIGLTRWSPLRSRKVDWVSGACLLGPKKVFNDELLFDEKIFMYMEEVDLLYRAKRKGYDTFFYPHSVLVHLGGGSSPNKKKDPVLNIYRGLVYFYTKHYGPVAIFALRFLLKLKASFAWAIGMLTGNAYLTNTYGEAFRLV